MNKELKGERKVIVKRNHKSNATIKQNNFINLNSLGNCTMCKISIALLIVVSFIVVKPQPQIKYDDAVRNDTLITSKSDTLRIVKTTDYNPSGLIIGANQ
jgi:hypothetical protein